MSRPRKAVKAVERQACAMWRTAGPDAPHIQFLLPDCGLMCYGAEQEYSA